MLELHVLSLRYSSWSMRPWLALRHAGVDFVTKTVEVPLTKPSPNAPRPAQRDPVSLAERRAKGSVNGLFPVLHVNGTRIHESLAICEWANERYPSANLWPEDSEARARARAVSCEMLTGFSNIRTHLSCHLFGRLKAPITLDTVTQSEVMRIFELWQDALERSGGPFLFGKFSIADCMYYPVRTRFRSYGVSIPKGLSEYVTQVDNVPAVMDLVRVAESGPRVPAYDDYMQSLGGDP